MFLQFQLYGQVTHSFFFLLFSILFYPTRLCYTIGPHWLSILNVTVFICQPQTPCPSHSFPPAPTQATTSQVCFPWPEMVFLWHLYLAPLLQDWLCVVSWWPPSAAKWEREVIGVTPWPFFCESDQARAGGISEGACGPDPRRGWLVGTRCPVCVSEEHLPQESQAAPHFASHSQNKSLESLSTGSTGPCPALSLLTQGVGSCSLQHRWEVYGILLPA